MVKTILAQTQFQIHSNAYEIDNLINTLLGQQSDKWRGKLILHCSTATHMWMLIHVLVVPPPIQLSIGGPRKQETTDFDPWDARPRRSSQLLI